MIELKSPTEIDRMRKKLGNEQFVAKAKPEVVVTHDPYAGPPRPVVRTADDYRRELSEKAARGEIDDDS